MKSEFGESINSVPCDRDGNFEPIVVPKHQSKAVSAKNMVISLYANGLSLSDIEQELYGYKLSTSSISIITDKVNQQVIDWQNRPLYSIYCIVWIVGIVFKVRKGGKVVNKLFT